MVNRSMTSGDPAPRGDRRAQLRQLGGVPSLADAPASLLADLVDHGHVVRIRPHWAVLTEGTAADKAYVLLDGQVEVRRGGVALGRCRPGEILGELGIVRRRLRSATVVTATEVSALHLDRAVFERLHDAHPYFRELVGEAMLRKTA
jgi:CRP/FNR family transcriptional regulator, cyclic AMP receptor protein